MDNNELVDTVSQSVGQAIGELSVGVAMALLATADAVSKQAGIDRAQFFRDMRDGLPEGEGVAFNVIKVLRESLDKAISDAAQG